MAHANWHHTWLETTTTTDRWKDVAHGINTDIVTEWSETIVDREVSTDTALSMRANDVVVTGENFKPNTRYYIFFDGIDVNTYMTPTVAAYGIGGGTTQGTGLRTDTLGKISATFSIPNTAELNFSTGTKTLKITDSSTNSDDALSKGLAQYEASGTITNIEWDVVATRNGRKIENILTDETLRTEVNVEEEVFGYVDPLAQSFIVDTKGGIFATSVEFYFGSVDTALPVTVQLRHMDNGFPTQKILPFGEKTLYPADVNTSADASSSTKFSFPSPVFLDAGKEYCIVLMSNSNIYTAWVSEMGGRDILTNDFIDQVYLNHKIIQHGLLIK
jgi:hypothetical protein